MDPIRPIGPPELDVEPVLGVDRAGPDGRRDHEQERRRRRERGEAHELHDVVEIDGVIVEDTAPEAPAASGDDEPGDGPHVDVRV